MIRRTHTRNETYGEKTSPVGFMSQDQRSNLQKAKKFQEENNIMLISQRRQLLSTRMVKAEQLFHERSHRRRRRPVGAKNEIESVAQHATVDCCENNGFSSMTSYGAKHRRRGGSDRFGIIVIHCERPPPTPPASASH